ncbi:probable imidazolonepropionase [Aplysia californica]|uniref:Probable imidazolonepropionase n=1 Tax=Aplysia californica TaxID=6500 RepID=A0ABM0JJB6_APLCA|nr:probable imidazolonepropionase [Aplysia californica]
MPGKYKLLVEHARQLVPVTRSGARFLRGDDMKSVDVMEGAPGGYSVLVDSDGVIADMGPSEEVEQRVDRGQVEQVIDASGRCVLPGFVDAHTHPVWAGDRVHEFALKLAGASYMEIHKQGGGIHYTVTHTRQASEDELFQAFSHRLSRMVRAGTTLVECKSGYGLDLHNEVKMLKVIERARRLGLVGISSTYCGAHAVPIGQTSKEATDDIINNQLPDIKKRMESGELTVDNIDVFCEVGVFDLEQTREILKAGKAMGLQINFHGEELHRLNSAEMGAGLGADAISHLEEVSKTGLTAMSQAGTVAVILPTTAYNLHLQPPPVRSMIDNGVIVALGTDFNPNAHCLAMPLVMNLACVTMKMSMQEALVAATLNAAHALGRSARHGSLEVGKVADMIIVDAPRWEHIIYQMGSHDSLISAVMHKGQVVHSTNL